MVNCFQHTFGENDTVGQHVTVRIKRFPARIPLMHSLRPTLITRLLIIFGWHSKQCCDKHQVSEAASLSLTQSWPQGNQMTDKKKFEQNFFFLVFLLLFSTSKQISAVVLAAFQGQYPRAIIMKPIRHCNGYIRKLLQKT